KEKLNATLEEIQELTAGSGDVLKELTDINNSNYFRKKQVIYSEGNRPVSLFYIQKGKVKTFKTNDYGKGLAIGLYSPGDFLGHIA
ncbi:cyclic nucleotide-binding domain-containing protein, partial [Klebsiella pneumoniae]|uniref:cyclic nucleotide-binding domain-containing protein n=1 Tax=Klebsiella pneumoniae TaxID=573 RepID=UPI0025A05064